MQKATTQRVDGTVGALIEALTEYPPGTEVVTSDGGSWFLLGAVRGPCGDDRLSATVVLEKGRAIR